MSDRKSGRSGSPIAKRNDNNPHAVGRISNPSDQAGLEVRPTGFSVLLVSLLIILEARLRRGSRGLRVAAQFHELLPCGALLVGLFLNRPIQLRNERIDLLLLLRRKHIVPADDKRRARLNLIRHLLDSIPYKKVKVDLPKIPKPQPRPKGAIAGLGAGRAHTLRAE